MIKHESVFSNLISWIENEESLVQFAGTIFTFPLSVQQLDAYVIDKNRFAYKVLDLQTGATIGHCEIHLPEDNIPKLCRILIGNKQFRGQGLGKQIVNELLKISFDKFNTTKVELNVYDWNANAISCYEKVGFIINPNKKRESQVNGKTWTSLNMTIDKKYWLDKLEHQNE